MLNAHFLLPSNSKSGLVCLTNCQPVLVSQIYKIQMKLMMWYGIYFCWRPKAKSWRLKTEHWMLKYEYWSINVECWMQKDEWWRMKAEGWDWRWSDMSSWTDYNGVFFDGKHNNDFWDDYWDVSESEDNRWCPAFHVFSSGFMYFTILEPG